MTEKSQSSPKQPQAKSTANGKTKSRPKSGSKRILKRASGRTIVADFSIAPTPPKAAKSDPNGYYEVLGLDPRRDWSTEDVKKAYWVRAKKFHPDGSAPNPDEFRRVQMAYAVLKDPEMRAKYDELDPKQQWLDEDIIAAIIKKVMEKSRVPGKDLTTIIRERLTHEGEEPPPPPPPAPRLEGFAYYYYEGQEVPSLEVREAWAEAVVRAMWDRGMRGEVRLGFTTDEPHVIQKQWGDVLMASGDPSTEAAGELVGFLPVHAA